MMNKLTEIIKKVSCNGMREMTDERVREVATEYAKWFGDKLLLFMSVHTINGIEWSERSTNGKYYTTKNLLKKLNGQKD